MAKRNIVIGQKVAHEKIVRSREMRREPTASEDVLWERLRRNGTGYHFRRQQIINGFIADFYCHAAGVVVEVDGSVHAAQPEADAERDRVFQGLELFVIRVSNNQVQHDLDVVVERIQEVCRQRTASPPPRRLD